MHLCPSSGVKLPPWLRHHRFTATFTYKHDAVVKPRDYSMQCACLRVNITSACFVLSCHFSTTLYLSVWSGFAFCFHTLFSVFLQQNGRNVIDLEENMYIIKEYKFFKTVWAIGRILCVSYSTGCTILNSKKERIFEAVKVSVTMKATIITKNK